MKIIQSNYTVSVSIVVHNQSEYLLKILSDLDKLSENNFEVILTFNTTNDYINPSEYSYPIKIIRNIFPKGFGANHNAAAAHSEGVFFAVVNPDIRLPSFSFKALIDAFDDPLVGAVAPVVLSDDGKIEDSARRFPTVLRLIARTFWKQRSADYTWKNGVVSVDWVAGMFILFRRELFEGIGGFDDKRFFMYMEDVDICRRLNRTGLLVLIQPLVTVVHNAQRASRRDIQHMRWHLVSAFRYLSGL